MIDKLYAFGTTKKMFNVRSPFLVVFRELYKGVAVLRVTYHAKTSSTKVEEQKKLFDVDLKFLRSMCERNSLDS